MNFPLRVLHLEDDARDTELVQAALEGEGIQSELTRVEREEDFLAALKRESLDLILADYTLPSFDGLSALRIAQQHLPDVPFIFVSGTLGEDVAIEALKTGATDYVLKTRLARLGPSVNRALREARERANRKRAEEAVRQSEKQLRDLIETIPAMAFVTRPDGSSEFVSRPWIEYSGLSEEQTAGSGWAVTLHPDDLEQHLAKWRVSRTTGQPFENEARHRDAHGNYRWLLARAVPLRDEQGNVLKWYGALTDIEDRKRAEALLAGEKRILEMIAKGDSLPAILDSLCQLVEEQLPHVISSVLLLEGDRLRHGGAPSLPKRYNGAIDGLVIGPSEGSCGTAAYRGEPVIVSDIATDPLWAKYRDLALSHSLRACWSTPIISSENKVLGTFAMYYREPRSPTSQDFGLVELATHLVRIAVERDRAEEALRTSEQLARSHVEVMMRSLDVLATEAAPEKFIAEMLRTIGQHLHARGVLLWLRNQEDDSLRLHLVIEGDQQVASDPDHPFVKDPQAWKRSLQEMLFTKGPVVCDDIERDPRIGPELREYLINRGRKKFLAIPMFVLGEVRGFIGIQHVERGPYRPEEIELAQALAHHVMMATHGAELAEQRRHAVVLEERTRMARDIHDTLAQGFTGVIIQLDTSVEALRDEEPEDAAKHIRRARELARESLIEARRSVHALRPQALENATFADALKAIITNTTAGTSLRTDFHLEGEPRDLEPAVEENLLHIGQEALSNALKHAHATKFQARLSFDSDAVRLELRDNGKGFVVDCANGGGIGLIGMRERAEQIGATLAVTSKPGRGTKILAVSAHQQPGTT
jgi:PAS domain S-box-containing protein